jgi:hypothetical protein
LHSGCGSSHASQQFASGAGESAVRLTREVLVETVYLTGVQDVCQYSEDLGVDDDPAQALVAWLRRLVVLANTKRGLIKGLAFNPNGYPAAHDALYAAGGPLIARTQEADRIDPDLDIDAVMRFAIGVSVAPLLTPHTNNADALTRWIAQVRTADLPHLHASTRGLDRDVDAVTNGLTLPYSNGPTEGVNTKTKQIARQMHGGAGFTLLRHRILLGSQHSPSPPNVRQVCLLDTPLSASPAKARRGSRPSEWAAGTPDCAGGPSFSGGGAPATPSP